MGSPQSGFITGPILTVLFLCLVISLTLGEALGYAAAGSRHKMDSLKAYLAFEETILKLDLGMSADSHSRGGFQVTFEEAVNMDGRVVIQVRLMEGGSLLEEVWLKGKH